MLAFCTCSSETVVESATATDVHLSHLFPMCHSSRYTPVSPVTRGATTAKPMYSCLTCYPMRHSSRYTPVSPVTRGSTAADVLLDLLHGPAGPLVLVPLVDHVHEHLSK